MNSYKDIYHNLVHSRKDLREEWKPVGSGLERHRILPGHQGGTYEESNCAYLTHREHIIAHWLLWKINRLDGDWVSWRNMKGLKGYSSFLGKSHSEETKEKIAKANKGRKHSSEAKEKMQEAWKTKVYTDEWKANVSKAMTGKRRGKYKTNPNRNPRIFSDEHKKKLKLAWEKRRSTASKPIQ